MNGRRKSIESILEEFLSAEIKAADERILSVKRFMEALSAETEKFCLEHSSKTGRPNRDTLIKLLEDTVEIYEDEIRRLLQKKEKINAHLLTVHVALCNGEAAVRCPSYLN